MLPSIEVGSWCGFGIDGHNEGIVPKMDVRLPQLLCGHAGLECTGKPFIDDLATGSHRILGVLERAMGDAFGFVLVVIIVVDENMVDWAPLVECNAGPARSEDGASVFSARSCRFVGPRCLMLD